MCFPHCLFFMNSTARQPVLSTAVGMTGPQQQPSGHIITNSEQNSHFTLIINKERSYNLHVSVLPENEIVSLDTSRGLSGKFINYCIQFFRS